MNREQAQCLLGAAVDATRKEVVSAHRRLISTVHPDKCSGSEAGRLARQATAARDVLLAPAESSSPSRRKTPPPVRTERVVDDGLRCLRVLVHRVGRPVDLAELLRMFRGDLKARGVSSDDGRCVGGGGGRDQPVRARRCGCSGVMMGAVANGEPLLTALAVPVLSLCFFASVWIMGRFGVSVSVLGRPAVFVPGGDPVGGVLPASGRRLAVKLDPERHGSLVKCTRIESPSTDRREAQ